MKICENRCGVLFDDGEDCGGDGRRGVRDGSSERDVVRGGDECVDGDDLG